MIQTNWSLVLWQTKNVFFFCFLFSDHEAGHYGPPAHCQIKSVTQKLHSIKHHTIKSCLAIEYWCMRKQEQDTVAEVKEVVRLIDHELSHCTTSLESLVRVVNTLEEENKHLKSELKEKLKIIADMSFDDIYENQQSNQPVQNQNTINKDNRHLQSELQEKHKITAGLPSDNVDENQQTNQPVQDKNNN